MGVPNSPARIPRLTMLGLVWVWVVLGMMGLVITLKPQLPGGWGEAVFGCIIISVFLTGLALVASLILQPWISVRRDKRLGQASRPSALWDREIDG